MPLTIALALVVAHACDESSEAAIRAIEARTTSLSGEVADLTQPKARARLKAELAALDDAIATLRATVGCRAETPPLPPRDGALAASAPIRLEVLDEAQARALSSVLVGERFEDVRLAALESGLSGRCLEPDTAKKLLDLFAPGAPRLDAWRLVAPRLTDRGAGAMLVARVAPRGQDALARRALETPPVAGCAREVDAERPRAPEPSSGVRDAVSDRPR